MDIEELRAFCLSLKGATEDIKWGHDLCFCIAGKMFCVTGLQQPYSTSFKVRDEEFEEMCARPGFSPAPYVARYKWVLAKDLNVMSVKDWKRYVRQSYDLVAEKLPAKEKKKLGL